jgi:hypothetical protein
MPIEPLIPGTGSDITGQEKRPYSSMWLLYISALLTAKLQIDIVSSYQLFIGK